MDEREPSSAEKRQEMGRRKNATSKNSAPKKSTIR